MALAEQGKQLLQGLRARMAPEGMASFLRAPNHLCYFVCFFALFVTYFVHNVSTTVSYDRKELLYVRTAITNLELDKVFYLMIRMRRIYF
jgi:hypothetical protein